VTIQLRYLQALSEISANQGSTIVFPLPLDMLRPLLEAGQKSEEPKKSEPSQLEPGQPGGLPPAFTTAPGERASA
jgi:hypothetical protein